MVTVNIPSWIGIAGIVAGATLLTVLTGWLGMACCRRSNEDRRKKMLGVWYSVYQALLSVEGIRLRVGILTEAIHRLDPARNKESRIQPEGLNMLRSAFYKGWCDCSFCDQEEWSAAWTCYSRILVKALDFSA